MAESAIAETPVKADPKAVHAMGDKFKSMLNTGDKLKAPEAKTEAKAEVQPGAKTAPVEVKGVPEFKRVEAKADAKTDPKTEKKEKTPGENFRVLEADRDQWRTKATEHEKRVKEYEAKLAETEAKIPADLDEKMKKLGGYEEFVQRFYVEHSDAFKRAFTDKIATTKSELKENITGANSEVIAETLEAAPGKWRDARIKELGDTLESETERTALVTSYKELKRIEKERDAELGKSGENFQKLTAAQKEEFTNQQRARETAVDSALKNTIRSAGEAFTEFKVIEGNAEHNAIVEENQKLARQFLAPNLKPEDMSRVAVYAVKGYRSMETDALKDALISKLQTQLKEYEEANPNLGGSGGGDKNKAGDKMSAGQKFKMAMETGVPKRE